MNGHRTCIICLPRTGSQLCEKLVAEISDASKLGEFFENWNRDSQYKLDSNSYLHLTEVALLPSPFKLTNTITEQLSLLTRVNPTQSLSIRLFLMDHYDKVELSNIVVELKNMGFEFITLVRDLREQLLSYMIAHTHTTSINNNAFNINSFVTEPATINISKFYGTLKQIVDSSINWGKNISSILNNIDYQQINYKTIYSDMSRIYNTEFKYSGIKSIKGDPFDLIVNKREVMGILDILIK